MMPENIAELKRIVADWQNSHYQINERIVIAELLEHIDAQAGQIATLKAALICERAYICSANVIETMPMYSGFIGMAKDQLVKEYPEINWKE